MGYAAEATKLKFGEYFKDCDLNTVEVMEGEIGDGGASDYDTDTRGGYFIDDLQT